MHRSTRLLGSLVLALAFVGCTSSGSSPAPVAGALTSGRITSEGGASAGVSVRAYGLDQDGTLTAASDIATTDADGHYTLHVTLDDAATALVVRVEDGSARMTSLGRAAVDEDVRTASTVSLAPIDARSTFVAHVVATVEASENVPSEESTAVALFLSEDAAAHLSASAERVSAEADAAEALSSARATFVEGLERSGSGDVHLALSAIASAEAGLAGRLDAAQTDAEVQAAYAIYLDAVIAAGTDAGFSLEAMAAASLSATSALEASVGDRVGGGRAELHELATFAVTAAVDGGMGASLGSQAVIDASASLRTSVQTMAAAGATADASASAWATYRATLESELAARAGLEATLLATLNADIDAALATLDATYGQIGASASASERAQAFLTYRSSVESEAHVALLTGAGLDADRARASLDAMADVRAATH